MLTWSPQQGGSHCSGSSLASAKPTSTAGDSLGREGRGLGRPAIQDPEPSDESAVSMTREDPGKRTEGGRIGSRGIQTVSRNQISNVERDLGMKRCHRCAEGSGTAPPGVPAISLQERGLSPGLPSLWCHGGGLFYTESHTHIRREVGAWRDPEGSSAQDSGFPEKEPRSPALPGSTPALPVLPRVEPIPSPALPGVPGKTCVLPSEGPWHV